jgi:alpha-tubulin suppressor-like RCC1 family protein
MQCQKSDPKSKYIFETKCNTVCHYCHLQKYELIEWNNFSNYWSQNNDKYSTYLVKFENRKIFSFQVYFSSDHYLRMS